MSKKSYVQRALASSLVASAGLFMTASTASAAVAACSIGAIEGLNVPGVSLVSATQVAANGLVPAYCDIVGELNTSGYGVPEGSAGFQLALPAIWNRKFLFFGVGGLGGTAAFNPSDAKNGLSKGYAIAVTDTGHASSGADGSWALVAPGVPDRAKVVDYYFRATHEVTEAGKQLAEAFFSESVSYAYFEGCSNGGRQAMVEAARFPTDFNGIIAGDPFFDLHVIVNANKNDKQQLTPETYIPATLLPMIDAAVNASCDAADGVVDGLIQNPAACSFNPYTLVCKAGQTSSCLTKGQAITLTEYISATRTGTGAVVYPGYAISNLATPSTDVVTAGGMDAFTTGFVPPSSYSSAEPWGNDGFSPAPFAFGLMDHVLKYIYSLNPAFDFHKLPVLADGFISAAALAEFDEMTQAANGDNPARVAKLISSDRKLLMYHGFSDGGISPYSSINFYERLAKLHYGYTNLKKNVRLFMVPGMVHCVGGPGPNTFDTLTALETWVEHNQAPESIVATHYINNNPAKPMDRTMPLCPFPTQATYSGSGDVNSATNWSCRPNQTLLLTGPDGVQAGADDN